MIKPVFGGLPTTQAQTSLRIHAVWSAPLLFAYWKVSYLELLKGKFQFSSLSLLLRRLVWEWPYRKPWRQVFSRRGPYGNQCLTLISSLLICIYTVTQEKDHYQGKLTKRNFMMQFYLIQIFTEYLCEWQHATKTIHDALAPSLLVVTFVVCW